MKTTEYFDVIRRRPDRAKIRDSWITRVVAHPEYKSKRVLVVLADGETVHNAFFDRGFEP